MDKEIDEAYNFALVISIFITCLLIVMVIWHYTHQDYLNAVLTSAAAGINLMNIFVVVILKLFRKYGRTFH